MQRLCGMVLAGALLLLAPTVGGGVALAQQDPFATADVVIVTYAIKANQTAQYEQLLGRLRDALRNSADATRNQMAQNWFVLRQSATLPNGDAVYTHIIRPVRGANGEQYSIMQTLYDEFPEERQALYELYQGAFSQNLGAAGGDIVVDMSR